MHLLVDISPHGLGHLAQTGPVLNALHVQIPRLKLTIRSGISTVALRRRIDAPFEHVQAASDFGFLMKTGVDIDFPASADAYRAEHRDWAKRVATEAAWQREQGFDAVVCNVAYLPLAAAAQNGTPSAALCSLDWAGAFGLFYRDEPWAGEIHRQMLAAYNGALGFVRITPGLPAEGLKGVHEIGPVARIGQRDRFRLAHLLELDPSARWVMLAMGGRAFPLVMSDWPETPGLNWLVPEAWHVTRDDTRAFDTVDMHFCDMLASVDAIVTKPGYGTLAEAMCCGTPMLCLYHDEWPEAPYSSAWGEAHGRFGKLSRERLLAGDFVDLLAALWSQPAPPVPQPIGIRQAVERLTALLRLDGE